MTVPSPATLQDRLDLPHDLSPGIQAEGTPRPSPSVEHLAALLRGLVADGRFHRDGRLGGVFHPGRLSLREVAPADSLHIVVHGDRVRAHVDHISPLDGSAEEVTAPYSLVRTAAHNVAGMARDVVALVRGRQGDHRCELDCEWLADGASDPDSSTRRRRPELLDPRTGTWSVHVEAQVGTLDADRLHAAFAAVLGDHPPAHAPLEVVDAGPGTGLDDVRDELHRHPVAPDAWPPFRAVLYRHHADGDRLLLGVNHAACDAVAALRVLRQVAAAYAGESAAGPALDFLATRNVPVRPAVHRTELKTRYRNVVEWLRNLPATPVLAAADDPTDRPGTGLLLSRLSADDTRRITTAADPEAEGDILMAALHRAVHTWNDAHGAPHRKIAVLVPVDLRPRGWDAGILANLSINARVATRGHRRSRHGRALRTIRTQTTRNKRTRSGIALVEALARAGLLPLWAKQSTIVLERLTANRRVDAAMLTHVGPIEGLSFGPDAGEAGGAWVSVPARGELCPSVGTLVAGDRLHVALRYPHRLWSASAARRFADTLVAEIRAVTEVAHAP